MRLTTAAERKLLEQARVLLFDLGYFGAAECIYWALVDDSEQRSSQDTLDTMNDPE